MANEHEFIGYPVFRTTRAVLFHCHFWEQPEWIPASQISYQEGGYDTMEVTLGIKPWFVAKSGLREFEYRGAQSA